MRSLVVGTLAAVMVGRRLWKWTRRAREQRLVEAIPEQQTVATHERPEHTISALEDGAESSTDVRNPVPDVEEINTSTQREIGTAKSATKEQNRQKDPSAKRAPPPPPPLPGKGWKRRLGGGGVFGINRDEKVLEVFQHLRQEVIDKARLMPRRRGEHKYGGGGKEDAQDLIQELARKSCYLKKIQAELAEHGSRIRELIPEINNKQFTSFSEVVAFVRCTDEFLSRFTDEVKVFKAFGWPKRYDALRDAVGRHDEIEAMAKALKDRGVNQNLPRVDNMKAIKSELMKTVERIERILAKEEQYEKQEEEAAVPTPKHRTLPIKAAALHPMQLYLNLALDEVSVIERSGEKTPPARQRLSSVVGEAVNLAYKVHQCSGGFSDGCSKAFGEVRRKYEELRKYNGA